jgi:hypothetical protein
MLDTKDGCDMRSLYAPALIAPIIIAALLQSDWAVLIAGAVAVGVLSGLLSHQQEMVETGAAVTGLVCTDDVLHGLIDMNADNMPIYLAGATLGVVPADNWFTAHMDGRKVLVFEPVEVPREG